MSEGQPAQAVFQESPTSAAIDGVRIGIFTAHVLVSMDATMTDGQRELLLEHLAQAREWMDGCREILGMQSTSAHIVKPAGGLIIP